MMKKTILVSITLFILVMGAIGQGSLAEYQEGRLYVRFKTEKNPAPTTLTILSNVQSNQLALFPASLMDQFGITSVGRAFRENASAKLNATVIVEFNQTMLENDLINALRADPRVELVEKIPLDRKHLDPNDPSLPTQWHLAKINSPMAWNYFSTGSTIVVAVVDDAVERTHPDLQPNIWVNPGEILNNGVDDDGNGYIDDINGWDIVNNNNNPDPPANNYDHGTHVAGIVSAATNNNLGIASIGFSCKIMCVKASGANPNSIQAGYQGILYAANSGANVINCSWGAGTFSATSQEVIDYARSKGCIVVASAGNNNTDAKNYPGAYEGVVSVASTDINDLKSGFSTFGTWVKISAPGSSILSTVPYGGYGNKSGTSMASPLVAGLLGLMKSLNPGMPNNDLLNCLYTTAVDISGTNPAYFGQLGAGRINAEAAMACVAATLNRAPTADFSGTPLSIVQGGKVTFTDKSIYNPTSWEWTFTGGTPATFSGKTPPQITYNTAGTYPVSLTVSNAFGNNTKTINNMVTVAEPPSCVSINYPATGTILDFLSPPLGATGFQNGVNANGDKQKAMYFDVSATNLAGITSIYVRFNLINTINPDKKIRFRVYDGTSGTPGAELGVIERTKGQLRQNVQANQITMLELPKNIDLPASKKFFVSVDISELVWTEGEKDSLSIRASVTGAPIPVPSPIWYQNSAGTWINYGTPASTWASAANYLLIHPILTSRPAKSVIAPTDPVVCQGTPVEFDATGSVYSGYFKWDLPGANPPTVVENVLKVTPLYAAPGTYKVFLTTRGGCQELRVDSSVITIQAAPQLEVVAGKNPLCQGETTTLTASGASDYTWSPATGLSATTGNMVQANPAQTITYSITGTNQNCSATIPFELQVRARTTDVTITASETEINGPTSVTFTAAGLNGGATPTYNFLVNDQSVQNGAASSMVRTVSPGDKVKCEFTSSEGCVVEKTVISNEIIMLDKTLPVTLFSFTGQVQDAGNRLMWTTTSELNSDYFEVQKSGTGTGFNSIGRVHASGNSSLTRQYEFLDAKPANGPNYYRLKMVDKDGSFAYSRVLLLVNNAEKADILYPNPSASGIAARLELHSLQKGQVNVSILDVSGRVLKNSSFTSTDGTLQVNLPSNGLRSGTYLVICKDANGNTVKTFRWQVLQ